MIFSACNAFSISSEDDSRQLSILVDADLLLNFFVGHPTDIASIEAVLEHFSDRNIQVHFTDWCFHKLHYYLTRPHISSDPRKLRAEFQQIKIAAQLKALFQGHILDISNSIIQSARQLPLKNFDAAVELTCARVNHLDGILAINPSRFDSNPFNLTIWSLETFLYRTGLERLLGAPRLINCLDDCILQIRDWLKHPHVTKTIYGVNTQLLIEAVQDLDFAELLNHADLFYAAGQPILWLKKQISREKSELIADINLLKALCQEQSHVEDPANLFLISDNPKVLEQVNQRLTNEFPHLKIAETLSLTAFEQSSESITQKLSTSSRNLILVSIMCPKQEILWIAQNRHKLKGIIIAMGQAFPIYARVYKRAPMWIQQYWGESLYRFLQAPYCLLKTYNLRNSLFFLWLLARNKLALQNQVSKWSCRQKRE